MVVPARGRFPISPGGSGCQQFAVIDEAVAGEGAHLGIVGVEPVQGVGS
jgi:hypothetical protein